MRNSLQKRTWAEVSLDNISHNYRAIRAALPEGCRFLGVVKADAYGHGAVAVARLLESEGADYLAVSCLDEAMELRSAGITMPLLILGHTPSEYTETLIDNDITQTVSCLAKAQEFSARAAALGRRLRIHIKIDTGMSVWASSAAATALTRAWTMSSPPAACPACCRRASTPISPSPMSRTPTVSAIRISSSTCSAA